MTLPSVIIASIIFSIMTMGVINQSSMILDMEKEKAQMSDMKEIKQAVLLDYEGTGLIEKSLLNLSEHSYIDMTSLTDIGGGEFHVLDNGNTTFTFNGSGNFRGVVLSSNNDGLDSSIDTNDLIIRSGEAHLLIAQSDLDQTSRGKTEKIITKCNTALSNFVSIEGRAPVDIYEIASLSYLDGKDLIDGFNKILLLNGSTNCYSSGLNGVDDSQLGDDVL